MDNHAFFQATKVLENTWLIRSHGSTAHLCAGEDEGCVVDTGDSYGDLRAFCEELCGKPVKTALNTHGHFDHTALNGQFGTAYIGRLAAVIAKQPNGGQPLERYNTDYAIRIVDDGDSVTVGGRRFEAIRMDGHSPDSIAWLDRQYRILFTGDNLSTMVPLEYKRRDPQPSVLRWVMSVAKLLRWRDAYDYVAYGHGETLAGAELVDHAMIAGLRALDGEMDTPPARKARPKEDGILGPIDIPPDTSSHDPNDKAFTTWKDVTVMYSRAYLRDPTDYAVVEGT